MFEKFFFIFTLGYTIPNVKSIQDFRSYIDNMPIVDSPEVMGLHPNADITYQVL